ncbi:MULTISPECIES: diguanylate cyclase [unclassified Fusibacter]|uniref:diguanylate cyclase n=1 Tax=unclassified Fusibacter TaxID=2624464 RepID=UPI0013E91712|nr:MULTISPECIES: diguanylate cyclase [unclassified Fusibacter]MCK8059678.1 diguanylate cyclase [Fusibacter sp. A2]NPE21479.1 diguanylate cyclase [Fusibacter sp. A1]
MDKNTTEIYKNIFDELNMMVVVLTTDSTLMLANKAMLDFSGLPLEELIGKAAWDLPWWHQSEEMQNELMFTLGHVFSSEETMRFGGTHLDKNGESFEIDFVLKPMTIAGEVESIIAMGYNITEMVKAKDALTQREKQINAFFEYSTEGYFFQILPQIALIPDEIDDKFIEQVIEVQRLGSINKKLLEYLGFESKDEVRGKRLLEYLGVNAQLHKHIWKEMITEGVATIQTEIFNRVTGKKIFLRLRFVAIYNDSHYFEGNFCIVSNITQQHLYERELNFLANKDPLTGLNNRRNFKNMTNVLFDRVGPDSPYSVCMLDIDKFKKVNDSYGHDVGDIVIRTVAEVIENGIGENGIVGRYGGEEFIIITSMSTEGTFKLINDIRIVLENTTISFGSGSLVVTVSGGISEVSANSDEMFDKGVVFADKALYESKNSGRNRVTIYDDELHGRMAIDRLTGVYTRKAIVNKTKQLHVDLRKLDRSYAVVRISLETLIVKEFAILNQFIKQTAGILLSLTRTGDFIGRYDDLTFIVLISGANEEALNHIQGRITESMTKLSNKFENLILAEIKSICFHDWTMRFEKEFSRLMNDDESS